MLGKGLESLIPQKGSGASGVPQPTHSQPPVPPQPQPSAPQASEPLEQAPPVFLSVFEDVGGEPEKSAPEESESIFHIEVEKIKPNPNQPRRNFNEDGLRELANSIREFGFLQPLVVSKIEKETPYGVDVEYQLIAGERRLLAAKLLGLPAVPAIVRNVNLEREKLELAVIENIQRENLNPIETARAFQRLQEEFRVTQREIAAKLGKSREVVANLVRLLDLPEYVRLAVEKGELSESHARFLLAVSDPEAQHHLFNDIVANKLTTRDVRERIRMTSAIGGASGTAGTNGTSVAHRRGRPPKQETQLPPELKAMKESLSSELGAPVEINKSASKGSISITFYSDEELENILRRLGSGS